MAVGEPPGRKAAGWESWGEGVLGPAGIGGWESLPLGGREGGVAGGVGGLRSGGWER